MSYTRNLKEIHCLLQHKSLLHGQRAIICENCISSRSSSINRFYSSATAACPIFKNRGTAKHQIIANTTRPYHTLRREVGALKSILHRSGFSQAVEAITPCLREKSLLFSGSRFFSTSTRCQQQRNDRESSQNDPEDKDKDPDEEEKMPFVARLMMGLWLGSFLFLVFWAQGRKDNSMYKFISWNEFFHDMLSKGEVEEIIVVPEQELAFVRLHSGAVIRNKKMDNEVYTLKIVDVHKFEDRVRKAEAELGLKPEKGVPISYQRESSWPTVIFIAIIVLAIFLFMRNIKIQMPNASDMFAGERKAKFVRADLLAQQSKPIAFSDVAGLYEAKIEVMEFVDYLKRPERYEKLGGKAPKGALLLGPPGCGKTLLAKALASEAKVPFLAMAGSEFVEVLGGLGAARVRDLFKEARQKAPCIVYVDEVDAIGRKRGGDNWATNSEEEHTLNQLLVEMDGMSTTKGVIMIGSTNRADILDKALLRPGRFDRHIMIDLPTLAERKETFDMYLRQLKLSKLPATYPERLAQLSPGMSGADIANICNEAALHAAREQKRMIDVDDFEYAVERVVAGVAKKSRVLSPQEKKIVAYHEAGHALVGWLLEHTDALLRVSIIPRTNNTLGFAQYLPTDKKLHSKEELFERLCMALGGRVAESLTFNSITSGAQDDLQQVTKGAYDQIRLLGMNEHVGLIAFPSQTSETNSMGTRPYSKHLTHVIDQEARLLVGRAYKVTEKILSDNKEKLRVIAEALLEKEVLTFKDVEQLIGPPKFGKKDFVAGFDPEIKAPSL